MQRQARRQDDEEHHEVREECPGGDVESPHRQFLPGRARSVDHTPAPERLLLFDLLRGLPEEQIRADGRAEDGDDRRPSGFAARHVDRQDIMKHLAPVRANVERRADVHEEDEGQPLEHAGEHRVAESDRRECDADAEKNHPYVRGEPGEQLGGIRHAGEVGSDVHGIRAKERERRDEEYRSGKAMAQRICQAASGHHADPGAHHLHRGHQRPGDDRCPQEPAAELRAGDGVRRDTGRIVVRGARDDPGSECVPESPNLAPGGRVAAFAGIARTLAPLALAQIAVRRHRRIGLMFSHVVDAGGDGCLDALVRR